MGMGDPVVGIVMGSDSDWPMMEPAARALEEFGVSYEAHVVSAHRTPRRMLDYAETAAGRGLRVVIAGAGGAAHLPGMLAAVTPLPVIGVPVPLKYLDGMDSLLSIVQMPGGVPVATVSIGALALLCTGLFATPVGLSQTEQFRVQAESVNGFDTLAAHFPSGLTDPARVIASTDRAAEVQRAITDTPGVVSVAPSGTAPNGLSQWSVVLAAAPASDGR